MNTIDAIQGPGNRVQSLRLLLLALIVGTFPFYCLAIVIIGSAPASAPLSTPTPAIINASFTPLGADQIAAPTLSATPPPNATMTPLRLLQPTPRHFIPPTAPPTDVIAAGTVAMPAPTVFQPAVTIVTQATTIADADADADGVVDAADTCPNEYGFADNSGCPYADDPDRDGIRAAQDLCPREFAPGSPRGCQDFDDDGLDTSQDECPRQAGPIANRGCPSS